MAKADLSAERLRELLHYDPETGVFTWRISRRKVQPGKVAGWVQSPGAPHKPRRCIEVDQRNYKAHRLAWLYQHGTWPDGVIDHKNGDSLDNRIGNLRDVSQKVNIQNERQGRRHSVSGLLGAHWDASRSAWSSSIRVNGLLRNLGRFSTAEEAHQAYIAAKRELHEGCTI
jgi:hypothetical protein